MNEYIVKKALKRCSAVGPKTGCSDCPYCYRCKDLNREALCIITEQEKEIEQLTRERNQQAEELAKEQEACVKCKLEQSWELFARDKEVDRLRAESKRFENNMKSVLEIQKKNVVKEFAEKLKQAICDNTYPYFDKNGKPVNIWNTDGFDRIDELLKEYEE